MENFIKVSSIPVTEGSGGPEEVILAAVLVHGQATASFVDFDVPPGTAPALRDT
jgi:hypothetical protein